MEEEVYKWPDFPLRKLLEKNEVGISEGSLLWKVENTQLEERLYETLPFLKKIRYEADLFHINKTFLVQNRQINVSTIKGKNNKANIFISRLDEDCGLEISGGHSYFIKQDKPSPYNLISYLEYQSLIPFWYWNEKIKFTMKKLIDPRGKMTPEQDETISCEVESASDCFAGYIVKNNREFYKNLDIEVPINYILRKEHSREWPYYEPLVRRLFHEELDKEKHEKMFNFYVEEAKRTLKKLF